MAPFGNGGFNMAKLLRWTGYVVGGLIALVLVAAIAIFVMSQRALTEHFPPVASRLAIPTAAQLADGPRQLHVLGCLSCHGEGLRGDKFLDEPKVATIHAPNLTLIAAKASNDQLDHAIRQGIGHDGRPLLIMPSEGYQFMTDGEVAALISAIRLLPKGGAETPKPSVGPIGRLGLALGEFHTAPELVRTFRANRIPDFGPALMRGRHIVEVNCAECHGPQLKGQEVEPGVVAPDLEIAAAYDGEQFRKLLREGVAPGKKDIGLMGQVARRDFKYLQDDEIAAIHAYLVERAQRAP
jgi:mono/diheme cytochrome c family protein